MLRRGRIGLLFFKNNDLLTRNLESYKERLQFALKSLYSKIAVAILEWLYLIPCQWSDYTI